MDGMEAALRAEVKDLRDRLEEALQKVRELEEENMRLQNEVDTLERLVGQEE